MAVTPEELTSLSACYQCLSQKQLLEIIAYTWANDAGMTPQEALTAASCFQCLSEKQLLQIVAYGAANDSGGGGGAGGEVGVVDPEGVVTADPGTSYTNTANLTFWIKTSGTGNTGWTQFI